MAAAILSFLFLLLKSIISNLLVQAHNLVIITLFFSSCAILTHLNLESMIYHGIRYIYTCIIPTLQHTRKKGGWDYFFAFLQQPLRTHASHLGRPAMQVLLPWAMIWKL